MSNQWRAVNFAARYRAPFQTMEALQEYLEGIDLGTRIACLICGRALCSLAAHLHQAHGVTVEDYKVEFGIPVTYGLASPRTSALLAENAVQRRRSNPLFGYFKLANLQSARLNKAGRPMCAAVRELLRSQLLQNRADVEADVSPFSAKARQKRTEKMKSHFADPGYKARNAAHLKRIAADPEIAAKKLSGLRKVAATPKFREKRANLQRLRWKDADYRAQMIAAMRKASSDLASKARRSAAMKKRFAKNRAANGCL